MMKEKYFHKSCMSKCPDMCPQPISCEDMVLAHAYVPWQTYDQAFCPEEALMKGTLFPELYGVYPIPQ